MIVQVAAGLQRWSRAGPLAASVATLGLASGLADGRGLAPLCGPGVSLEVFLLNAQLVDLPSWSLQWTAMLCAMMLPLLILPIEHIERTTFRRDLPRSVLLFVVAYLAAWLLPGICVMLLVLLLRQFTPAAALWIALAAAVVWSASPVAQRARNRSHRLQPLAVNGWAAWGDCLRFGGTTGAWCVLACWPWMVVCETLPGARVLIVPALGLLLLAERAMPPVRPRWQLPRFVAFLLALRRPYRDLGRV